MWCTLRCPVVSLPLPPLPPFAPAAPPRTASPHPAGASRAPRTSLPRATPLFRLPAAPPASRSPSSSARLFLRAISHALRPCRTDRSPGKGVQAMNPVNAHFVCVSDAHARSRKGSVTAPPPRMTRVSVEPQRVTHASPCRPSSPSPFRPTASPQRPP